MPLLLVRIRSSNLARWTGSAPLNPGELPCKDARRGLSVSPPRVRARVRTPQPFASRGLIRELAPLLYSERAFVSRGIHGGCFMSHYTRVDTLLNNFLSAMSPLLLAEV